MEEINYEITDLVHRIVDLVFELTGIPPDRIHIDSNITTDITNNRTASISLVAKDIPVTTGAILRLQDIKKGVKTDEKD